MMDMKKVLILLAVLVVFINYNNYIKQDDDKLLRKIALIKQKISQEKEISKRDIKKKDLLIKLDNLMFDGNKYTYSEAMGEMQNILTKGIKTSCKFDRVKWAQVASSDKWYDILRMNVYFRCEASKINKAINAIKKSKKLFYIESLNITPRRKGDILSVSMQVVAYRKRKSVE
jgi:Tfp pilus assembly protein PilO